MKKGGANMGREIGANAVGWTETGAVVYTTLSNCIKTDLGVCVCVYFLVLSAVRA